MEYAQVMISLQISLLLIISQSHILPLTTSKIPSTSLLHPPNKLHFHHNITLTVSLRVGTPPQNITMVLDTGSELSYLNCNLTQPTTLNNQTQPPFDPTQSTTYTTIPCTSPTCTNRTSDLSIPASCDPTRQVCHATLSYADMSSAEGDLASDTFHVGNLDISDTVFGCMVTESSSNPVEDAKTTGLLGMNRGSLSFISQMDLRKFSYCISSGLDEPGVLLLGDDQNVTEWLGLGYDVTLNYTPLVRISDPLPYYNRVAYTVQFKGIKVGDKILDLPESLLQPDHTGAGQTMVDSGTQFSILLGPAYTALRSEYYDQTKHILGDLGEPDYTFAGVMDLCYRVPCNQTVLPDLPTVTLLFEGADMQVSGTDRLVYRVPGETRDNDAVYCFTFGNSDLLGVEAYIIGHHHQQNVWMEFDLEKSRMGLAPLNCDLAVQKLGLVY
ncbi:aspartic proteinase PCS1-like [Silene latifolia]|uniref:aspartic proteinase PCS1-like n=1 Tax=Silene latifolia TaxID=37657 RepID=UPI003D77B85B